MDTLCVTVMDIGLLYIPSENHYATRLMILLGVESVGNRQEWGGWGVGGIPSVVPWTFHGDTQVFLFQRTLLCILK